MSYVVTLEDFQPGQRYDATPWTQARIEESTSNTGPWTTVETSDLDPVDTDPEQPASRDFTTSLATLAAGWYRVVFLDADGSEQVSDPVFFPSLGLAPALTEVAALLRARSRDDGGDELGTFTSETRPTESEVRHLIDQAVADVEMRVGEEVAGELEASARYVVALRTAALIELSYFPEQSVDALTAYQSLRLTYEEALGKLVTAVQVRSLFAEKKPNGVEA